MIGVLAGAEGDAILDDLFAPDKFSTLRNQFLRKNNSYTEEHEEWFSDLIDNIT